MTRPIALIVDAGRDEGAARAAREAAAVKRAPGVYADQSAKAAAGQSVYLHNLSLLRHQVRQAQLQTMSGKPTCIKAATRTHDERLLASSKLLALEVDFRLVCRKLDV